MNWTQDKLNNLPQKDGFRLRGTDMTRLETFTDAAFAFATTMLVISVGTIPKSYGELITALQGAPAFAASFASVTSLWIAHRKWSRRYGLEDTASTLISLSLVFIMLIYVYPLKMIFSAMFAWISRGWLPTSFEINSADELVHLFIIYGLGFALVMLMYVLLYLRASRVADLLLLNHREQKMTALDMRLSAILALTGLASAVFAVLMPTHLAVYAGLVYTTLPATMPLAARYFSREIAAYANESN